MKIEVLYEDKDILAIDKPSGILVHPVPEQVRYGAGPDKETVIDIFKKKYPKLEIVHRLDKETSGVLLLAKNKKAHEFLKDQFKNREIKKTYNAVVSGNVKNDHATINKPIGRSPKDFRRRLAGRGVRGELREAITEYRVLKRFETQAEHHKIFYVRGSQPVLGEGRSAKKSYDAPLKFTYLEIHPKTGRTHQIRVHMKFINHPVACDSLYNPDGPCLEGFKRLALHAKSIEFKDLKGKIIKVESLLPKEFKKILLLKDK
ncbi:MAG: RluA family pseudouridine synthase [Candidatus Paceibacterota bacterium]